MTSGTHYHVHGRCGQLPLVEQTLLRGFLIDALVLGVVASLAGCGDDLVPACFCSFDSAGSLGRGRRGRSFHVVRGHCPVHH